MGNQPVEGGEVVVPEPIPPTQVRHPNRTTLRSVVQGVLALAIALPILVQETGLKTDQVPWLATVLAVAAVIVRIMANPRIDAILTRMGLGARPKSS